MQTMQKKGTFTVTAILSVVLFAAISILVFTVVTGIKATYTESLPVAFVLEVLLAAIFSANLAYKYSKLEHQGEAIWDNNLQCEVLCHVSNVLSWSLVLVQVNDFTEGVVKMGSGDINAIRAMFDRGECSQMSPLALVRRADNNQMEEHWYVATLATREKSMGAISIKDPHTFVSLCGNVYHLQSLSDFWPPAADAHHQEGSSQALPPALAVIVSP